MITNKNQNVGELALGVRQTPLQQGSSLGERQRRGFFYISDAAVRETGALRKPSACAGARPARSGARSGPSPAPIYLLENIARWASGPRSLAPVHSWRYFRAHCSTRI